MPTRLRNLVRYSVCVAIALASCPVFCANFADVYQLAVAQDPVLQSARSQRGAAGQEKAIALADYLPQFGMQVERSETVQDVLSTDNLVFTSGKANYPSTNYTATLSQAIVDMGAFSNIKRSLAAIEAADAELIQVEQDLVLRTAEAYFAVLAAQDQLSYVQAEKASVRQNLELVQAQHQSGLARITDLRDAEARYATVLSSESEARNDLYAAQLTLEEIIGSSSEQLSPLLEEFEPTRPQPDDVNTWLQVGVETNPTVLSRRKQLEAARHEVDRLQAGHYPEIGFEARYDRNDARGSLYGGGSEVETVKYAFQLRVPVLAGGRVYAQVKQAAELLERARSEVDRAQRDVKRRTETSFVGIESAIARVQAMTKAVEAQELARTAKDESYRSGLLTLIAVLDAERDLFIARADLARAKYDFILESLRLEQAAGSLDSEDVSRVNAWLQ